MKKNTDDELQCMEYNKCDKPITSVTSKGLQTVFLGKRKQQQNLNSQPGSKKQNTGLICSECGNLGHISSSCVQRKEVEHPTKKQKTVDITKIGQPQTTNNKALESPKPIRSEPNSKEKLLNKNFEEKNAISKSGSYHQTSDNTKVKTSGHLKYDDNNKPTSEQREHSRNEPVSNSGFTTKKYLKEKSISLSGAHLPTPNQLINSLSDSNSNNGKPISEHRNTNDRFSNSPHGSSSEQRMKLHKCSKFDSKQPSPELRKESLSKNSETVHYQPSHEHNSRQIIDTRHRYNQHYDEWRQTYISRSPSVPYKEPSPRARENPHEFYTSSYHFIPSRKAEDPHRFHSVAHQYSFERLESRTGHDYNSGHQLMDHRPRQPDYQYHHFQGQRTREAGNFVGNGCWQDNRYNDTRNFNGDDHNYSYRQDNRYNDTRNFNRDGYHYSYMQNNGYNEARDFHRDEYNYSYRQDRRYNDAYGNWDEACYQSHAERPPLPSEPYPYQPPPPSNDYASLPQLPNERY